MSTPSGRGNGDGTGEGGGRRNKRSGRGGGGGGGGGGQERQQESRPMQGYNNAGDRAAALDRNGDRGNSRRSGQRHLESGMGCSNPPPPPPYAPQADLDLADDKMANHLEELRKRDDNGQLAIPPQRAVTLINLINTKIQKEACNPSQLADIMYTMGKLHLVVRQPEVIQVANMAAQAAGGKAKYKPEQMDPVDLANVVMCIANMSGGGAGGTGSKDDQLMSIVAAEVVKKIQHFLPKELANTAWAFAKCGLWNEVLVKSIAQQCIQKMDDFLPINLSTLAWAMAQWGNGNDELFQRLSTVACQKADQFMPANLAMISWAFSSVNKFDKQLSQTISLRVRQQLDNFRISELSHLVWAYANHKLEDTELFEAVSRNAQTKLKDAQPSELSNIAWACAKVGFVHDTLLQTIAKEAVEKISGFKPHEIAQMVWAFAVAGISNPDLMLCIGTEVAGNMENYTSAQLSHIAWAFGAVSTRHIAFMEELAQHALQNLSEFKAHGLSNIIWAMAMVGHTHDELMTGAAEEILRGASELRPVAFSRCAWAWRRYLLHMPELQKSFTMEALKKEREFPIKAWVKFTDARYPSATQEEMEGLLRVLEQRVTEVTSYLRERWPRGTDPREVDATVSPAEYSNHMNSFQIHDLGVAGTPIALKQLGIRNVSKAFMKKCLVFEESSEQKAVLGCIEYNIFVNGTALQNCLCRSSIEPAAAAASAGQWLLPVDSPPRIPGADSQPTFALLADLCNLIGQHVQIDTIINVEQDASHPQGVVEVFSSMPPSLSCIGALWQFSVLFQGVQLKYTDHAASAGYFATMA